MPQRPASCRASLRRLPEWRLFFSAVLFCVLGVILGGCGSAGEGTAGERGAPLHGPSGAAQEAFQEAEGTREAALRALDSLKRGALRAAFGNANRLAYTRHVRTEQLGPNGRVNAFEEHVARHTPGGGLRVVQSDSGGTFSFGALGRMVRATRFASTAPGAPAPDLAQQVLPEELAFLSERNRYAFQYRLLPDTTLAGGPARVVAVRARPGPDGDNQPLRHARLYLDAGTGQLVALRMHRVQRSLLFDEDTRQYVRIRPAPGHSSTRLDSAGGGSTSAWVPAETRFQTRLHMPLRPARRFRSSASYYQYRAAS